MGPLNTWRPLSARASINRDEALGFVGTIKRETREKAIAYAHRVLALQESGPKNGPVYMTLFVDASMAVPDSSDQSSSPGAYSVVYKDPKDGLWVEQAWFVEAMFNNNWGEAIAIAEALNMATLHLRLQPPAVAAATEIRIFTDSTSCLDFLERQKRCKNFQHKLAMTPVQCFINKLSHELYNLGARLTLSFHPGHGHDVEGHAAADIAALKASLKGSGKLHLLEPSSPGESSSSEDSTPTAHQDNNRKVEGQATIDKAVHGAFIEGPKELQLLKNSPSGSFSPVDRTSTAHQGDDRVAENHAAADSSAFEVHIEGSGDLQPLENSLDKTPSPDDSTSTAHHDDDHAVEGHRAACNVVSAAHMEDHAKKKMLEPGSAVESSSSGPEFKSAAHRGNDVVYQSKTSQQHNAIWTVLHHLGALNISFAALRREDQPTKRERIMIQQLNGLLRSGPPAEPGQFMRWQRETQRLRDKVGRFL